MTLLASLVAVSQRVRATAARLAKVRELAGLLNVLEAQEVAIAVCYLSGDTPQGRLGIGYSLLHAAAAEAATITVAENGLSIAQLDAALTALCELRGSGSAQRRARSLRELFGRATPAEREFLSALLLGELRQGALAGVMIDAIAMAAQLPAAQIRRAAMYARTLGEVARVALLEGGAALQRFRLVLFSPVAPMLAQTAADVAAALAQLSGEVAFEWKMDGARIQLHKSGEEVRIYTRTLNEVTAALPEIVQLVRRFAARELVLDGEAIAYDASDRPHPFQITMRRFGRKLEVERLQLQLPIRAYLFDCLHIDGQSIADRPTRVRAEALAQAVPSQFRMPRLVTAALTEAQRFYDAALEAGHEGVMAKTLDAPYEAGSRDARWLKIKRAHSLDLIVLAAEWGHGRRAGKLSNLHLGALDPASGDYLMLGKTFKGLTDATLAWQTQQLLARETHRDRWTVYVRPELVVEVAFSDLQASTRYPGGVALRLARVKRYREDKRAEDADSMTSVRAIFAAQGGAPAR